MTTHYLIHDEILIIGKENSCRYYSLKDITNPEEIWKQEVRIIDPYGDHELSNYYPNDKWEIYNEDGESPAPGYKFPKYYARVINDASVWKYLKYKSWGDDPQEVRIFRKVYELKGGELPALSHRTESRYAW